MSETIIAATGVTKMYGPSAHPTAALNGLSLQINRGEFVSLMGPSGSGKTTLLNLVAGLDRPDRGKVFLDGSELGKLKDHQLADLRLRKVGFVFQSFNLIPALTVEENVWWPLEFSGYRRTEVRDRTAAALQRVGVVGCEKRYPAELSGGEQQRVAIARAIATTPPILLADEPTGNLDSSTGTRILDLLLGFNQTSGTTIVMVTHNAFAATYGDRTLELRDGRIVRDIRRPTEADEMEPDAEEA